MQSICIPVSHFEQSNTPLLFLYRANGRYTVKNRIIHGITYHIKKLEGNLLQRHRCTKNCIPLSRCNRMRPARTWTAGRYGGEGAAINTAINRRHKSLALLPALCIDIVVAALSAPGLNPSHDESGKHRQRGDVRKERKATYGSGGGMRREGRERDTHPRCRVERRPTHGRVSIRGCHGGGCSITLLLPRTQTRRVYRGLDESARSGPLILLADRMRPDPDPSVHSTLEDRLRGTATSLPIARTGGIFPRSFSRGNDGGSSCDSVVSWMGMMVMIMMARWLAVLWKIVARLLQDLRWNRNGNGICSFFI